MRSLQLPLFALALAACTAMPDTDRPASASTARVAATKAAGASVMPPGGGEGASLELRLSDAQPPDEAAERTRSVAGDPLGTTETAALLARLPAMETDAKDRQDFALRSSSRPAPRPGRTVEQDFPPAAVAPIPGADEGPLEVLRHGPEGEIPGAPALSVTFSQAMVPLTSHDELAAKERPAVLAPEPPGAWRWVGTRTLLFEPEERFPRSTRYEARVPAGVRSEAGGVLADELSWAFETPRLKLSRQFPRGDATPLQPLIVLGFDQPVDADALLSFVEARAGRRELELREASAEELAENDAARRIFESLPETQRLALRPAAPLPQETSVRIVLKAGAPSAEGPLTTREEQSFEFRTHGPFEIVQHRCGWRDECRPGWPWTIELSNPIDEEHFHEGIVSVEPELPGLVVSANGRNININGLHRARTKYTVTVAGNLRDRFGQSLGKTETLRFEVDEAYPQLRLASGELVLLDPAGPRELPVFSQGFEALVVQVHAVEPEQWKDWLEFKQRRRDRSRLPLPGRRVVSKTIRVEGGPDELVETRIALGGAFTKGLGHAVVSVVAGKVPPGLREPPEVAAWVQATEIGLDALVDAGEIVVWTNRLADGAPLPGVQLELLPSGTKTASGEDALGRLPLSTTQEKLLIARSGADSAFLPQSRWHWDRSGWRAQERGDRYLWHLFDDRGLYKPGETVRVKGWLRRLQSGEGGDTTLPEPMPAQLAWTLNDSRGNELAKGETRTSALGGFDLELELPDDMNLGPAQLRLEVPSSKVAGARHAKAIEVQEFRRPEYEVTTLASEGPFFAGGSAEVTVTADYYAGGHLPGAEVTWRVTQRAGSFRPPGWKDFRFGRWTPWWWQPSPVARGGVMPWMQGEETTETHSGATSSLGAHHLKLDFGPAEPPLPVSVTASATVQDLNRQAWSDSSNLLVHPAAYYVGLRTRKSFVEKGKPLDVELIVTDLDGNALAGREVVLEAERSESRRHQGEWKEEWVDRLECRPTTGEEPVLCSFAPDTGGRWRVRALVADDEGRKNLTEITVWVAGGDTIPSRGVEQERVDLIPEQEEHAPGDTARLLVQAPFFPAEGLLSLRRDGLVETRRFRMETASTILEIPIEETHAPNLHLVVELDGRQLRNDANGRPNPKLPKRPAFAQGEIDLKVPPVTRSLDVALTPEDPRTEPGATTAVDLTVTGHDGRPVADAEVAVVVADEAVLALTGYEVLDPLDSFHPRRGDGVNEIRSRSWLLLAELPPVEAGGGPGGELDRGSLRGAKSRSAEGVQEMAMAAPMAAGMAAEAPAGSPIALRTDFDPIAAFAPLVVTDASGRARVDLKLPDNLTRYRVFAVAVAGDHHAGTGESSITARLPVMARLQPPRFLNFGDRVELPLVIQNQTASPRRVDVALRASNLAFEGAASRSVEVAGHDRVELRFPAAAEQAGTARVQVGISSGRQADAMESSFPVWTPATTEAFAAYGELDDGAVLQALQVPGETWPQFGGLEIATSSTALQGLTDAVIYLVDYPYDCAEQISARILAIAALRDVLAAFEAEGLPAPEQLEARVAADLKVLEQRQNPDGGFGLWRRGQKSWPFVSVQAAHAMQRAKEKGFAVPERLEQRCRRYLQSVEAHLRSEGWSEAARRALLSQALMVRERLGDADAKRARKLYRDAGLDGLSLESLGWLLPTLKEAGATSEVAEIRRHLLNQVTETASTAEFTTSYGAESWFLFHSSRRSDAVLLEALLRVEPELDLIPKLARGLLAHRKRGRWGSTQENAWVLLSLDAYFREFERVTPDFVARAWLGDGLALEQEYRGRSTDRHRVEVPMSYLAEGPERQELIVGKEGAGRLYWRLGLRYAPRSLKLEPAAHGFEVERSYEAVDDPEDVRRDADGTWRVKAGARVRVKLSMATPGRRYHVALVDPLPAGFEALNPSLAVTEQPPPDQPAESRPWGWWWGRWHEHENLRDERAEAFASLLWAGAHSYSYTCRATTPGRFVVPPARAEEMYAPETFGRSASEVVVVE